MYPCHITNGQVQEMSITSFCTRSVEVVFSFLFFLIAFTSLALWPAQSLGLSFAEFRMVFPLLVIFAAALATFFKLNAFTISLRNIFLRTHVQASEASKFRLTFCLTTFVIALIITGLGLNDAFSYTWVIALLGCIALLTHTSSEELQNSLPRVEELPRQHALLLNLTSILLVFIYLLSSVTNADDTHFVSYIAGLLQFPDEPLFSKDIIFNSSLPNHIFSLNLGQSWELIIAALSHYTGISHLFWYYTLAPCLFITFVPWVIYAFVKQFSSSKALAGTLFSVLFLVLWSTHNHMHGFFFIPRFFQGKALLLMLFVPVTCHFVLLWCRTQHARFLVATGLAMVACGGVSSTGFYISGVAAGVSLLAFTPWNIKVLVKNVALLALVSLPNLAMIFTVKQAISETDLYSPQAANIDGMLNVQLSILSQPIDIATPGERPISSMYWLFGDQYSLFLILGLMFCALLFVYASNSQTRQVSLRWLCLVFIICFSHPLSSFLGETIGPGNLIWRFHWGIPLSLVIALSISLILQNVVTFTNAFFSSTSFISKNALAISYFAVAGPIIIMAILNSGLIKQKYSSEFNFYKVPTSALRAAQRSVELTSQSDIIIAQELVSQMLPMLPRSSSLVASRPLYWNEPYFTVEETKFRQYIQALTDNLHALDSEQLKEYKISLKLAGVTVLIAAPLSKEKLDALSLETLAEVDTWAIYRFTG